MVLGLLFHGLLSLDHSKWLVAILLVFSGLLVLLALADVQPVTNYISAATIPGFPRPGMIDRF